MNKELKYKETDKMAQLICDDYSLLQVMSRFGMSLGFGDKNVREVCEQHKVDAPTFLAVINFMAEGFTRVEDELDQLSVGALVDYLKQSHIYFLDFSLPTIRQKLIEAIEYSDNDVSFLILKFFDNYMSQVRRHMEYEEKTVFKFVEQLLAGNCPENYHITTFSKHHAPIDETLTELKNIIIKYYPAGGSNNKLNAVLFDIFSCEEGLNSHCKVEDYIFVPAVMNLERRLKDGQD